MQQYVIRRGAFLVLTLLGVTLLVSGLMRTLPGDPVDIAIAELGWTPAQRPALEKELGVDKPWPIQYAHWLGKVATGDLGQSLQSRQSINSELQDRFVVSLELAVIALVIAIGLGIPLGVISGMRPNSWLDQLLRGTAVAFLSTPGFWIATLVIIWPSIWWAWSPPTAYRTFWSDPIYNIELFGLPAFLLGLNSMGALMRITRAQILEVRSMDYVRTARAKGLSARSVTTGHILRNSMIPLVSLAGIQLPTLIGGAVIYESIFNLPGMGQMLLRGLNNRDYPVVQALNLLFATAVVVGNLVVDLLYTKLDPRITFR